MTELHLIHIITSNSYVPHRTITERAIQPGPPAVDEEVVAMLTSMGFSVNGSKRAMLATGSNDPDTAMNW